MNTKITLGVGVAIIALSGVIALVSIPSRTTSNTASSETKNTPQKARAPSHTMCSMRPTRTTVYTYPHKMIGAKGCKISLDLVSSKDRLHVFGERPEHASYPLITGMQKGDKTVVDIQGWHVYLVSAVKRPVEVVYMLCPMDAELIENGCWWRGNRYSLFDFSH